MAETDPVLREIEEDMQREKMLRMWQLFGRYIIALSVFVVVLTVSYVLWQNHREGKRAEVTARYIEATHLAEAGNYKEAAPAFGSLRRSAGGDLATLAGLRQAQALAADKQPAAAWKIYAELANDGSAAPALRNLALLLARSLAMDLPEIAGPDIKPAQAEGAVPFGFALREQQALDAFAAGKAAEATTILSALHAEQELPATQRQRVGELLAYFGQPAAAQPAPKR